MLMIKSLWIKYNRYRSISGGKRLITNDRNPVPYRITCSYLIFLVYFQIKNLKNNSTVRASVRPSFEKSYNKVEQNLAWFNSYSDGITQWTSQYGEKEEDTPVTTVAPPGSTVPPVTSQPITPKPSSATSNSYNGLLILQLPVLAVLIKTYIL